MKEFYIVDGDHVEKRELRETPKFYIDDVRKTKFKKIEGQQHLGSCRHNGGSWCSTTYYLYALDHEKPNQIIEKNKRSMFAYKVRKAAKEKISSLKKYSDFVEINEILKLNIEL